MLASAVAFAAATILPMQSEAALAGLLLTEAYPAALLIAVASLRNVLGRGIEAFRDRPWFPANQAALDRATRWYH